MIIVFDAKCLLCNGPVQFLLSRDRRGVFRFAAARGAAGRDLLEKAGLQEEGFETFFARGRPRAMAGNGRVLPSIRRSGLAMEGGLARVADAGAYARRDLPLGGEESLWLVWTNGGLPCAAGRLQIAISRLTMRREARLS